MVIVPLFLIRLDSFLFTHMRIKITPEKVKRFKEGKLSPQLVAQGDQLVTIFTLRSEEIQRHLTLIGFLQKNDLV